MARPNLQKLMTTAPFILLTHLVLVGFLALHVIYIYESWKMQKDLFSRQRLENSLLQENTSIQSRQDYFNSTLYKRKFAKQEGYIRPGEEVIDPMIRENLSTGENADFIPRLGQREESNLDRWQKCFFGGTFTPKTQAEREFLINSLCRTN